MTRQELVQWLEERRDNCARIAAMKSDADREGWLEDQAYFEAATKMLESPPHERRARKMAEAVHAFCEQQSKLAEFRRTLSHCTESDEPDYDTGYPGSPGCALDAPIEVLCQNCRVRVETLAGWRAATKLRAAAKRKLMHWWARP